MNRTKALEYKPIFRNCLTASIVMISVWYVTATRQRLDNLKMEADARTRYILASQEVGTGLVEIDPTAKIIVYADIIASGILGYGSGELNGRAIAEIVPADFVKQHTEIIDKALLNMTTNMRRYIEVVSCPVIYNPKRSVDSEVRVVIRFVIAPSQKTIFATINRADETQWHLATEERGRTE